MKQICGDCLHYNACAAWNIGSLANTDAGNCINFEHIHLYDSVEVVRCKDCKHINLADITTEGKCRCDINKLWQPVQYRPYRGENDYCSYGERKRARNEAAVYDR